jgi:hypothetical protein
MDLGSMSFGSMFASMAFGCVGFAAWQIGRRQQHGRRMLLGIVLMIYPWFVDDVRWMVAIGVVLTGALFLG